MFHKHFNSDDYGDDYQEVKFKDNQDGNSGKICCFPLFAQPANFLKYLKPSHSVLESLIETETSLLHHFLTSDTLFRVSPDPAT